MLLMESKQEEQILLVHWENFLIMVTTVPLITHPTLNSLLHSIFLFICLALTVILTYCCLNKFQDVMLLDVRCVSGILFFYASCSHTYAA